MVIIRRWQEGLVLVIDALFVALASTGIVSVVTSEWLAKLFGKLEMSNPVMTASGTFGYGLEFQDFVDRKKLSEILCGK